MGFKDYSSPRPDTWVNLGGRNKEGKKNPGVLEGYYLGRVEGVNQFDTSKMKVTFIFQNAAIDGKPVQGIVGVNGSANLIQKMKDAEVNFRAQEGRAPLGTRTLITHTGELNLGKGNPMKTFTAQFDAEDSIEVTAVAASLDEYESDDEDTEEATDGADEDAAQAAALLAAERAAKVQELLNRNKAAAKQKTK